MQAAQSTKIRTGIQTLVALAWPVVLARSSQSIIGFCDALMIAPLGEDALAATTTGAINTSSLAILPMGVVMIVQSFASQLTGKSDVRGARRYAWYGLVLATVVALVFALAIPLIPAVLGLFAYEPDVHRHMSEYMSIRLLAIGAILGTEVLGNWYGGLGNTRLHMAAGLLAMVFNVFLNWVLIQGHLGAPALGVRGAAIASVISTWAGFALLALAFARGWGFERVRGALELRWSEFARMLRFGVPNGINWFLEFAAFTFFINVVVADLGTVALAAMMVIFQINSVSFMPAFGLASAGAILSGQAIGKNLHDEVPAVVRRTMALTAAWQCGVGLLYLLIPAVIMSWFLPPTENAAELLGLGTTLLIISAAWQLFDAIGMTLSETLRAAGDTAWCMWARLSLAWVLFAPLSFLTVKVLAGGPVAAILCVVCYLAALAAVFAYRFYISAAWRRIDMTASEPVLV